MDFRVYGFYDVSPAGASLLFSYDEKSNQKNHPRLSNLAKRLGSSAKLQKLVANAPRGVCILAALDPCLF